MTDLTLAEELGVDVDLDSPIPCRYEGCDQPAVYREVTRACHCSMVLCAEHTLVEANKLADVSIWSCGECSRPLGLGFGYWFADLSPL